MKRTALPGRVIGRAPIPVFSRRVSGIGFDILDINLSGYADTVRSTGARTRMVRYLLAEAVRMHQEESRDEFGVEVLKEGK